MADMLTPSKDELQHMRHVVRSLEDVITDGGRCSSVAMRLIGSAATETFLSGTWDIDAFLVFQHLHARPAVEAAFRESLVSVLRQSGAMIPEHTVDVKTYPAPRVCIKANLRFCGHSVSLAGIGCVPPIERVATLADDIYYHPSHGTGTAQWRREVCRLKVVRRLAAIEGVMCGFACECGISATGSAQAVVEAIAAGRWCIDSTTPNGPPVMLYPYAKSGNLLSRITPAHWSTLGAICRELLA